MLRLMTAANIKVIETSLSVETYQRKVLRVRGGQRIDIWIVIRIAEPQRNFTDCDLTEAVTLVCVSSQLPDPGPVVKSKPAALSRCQPNQSAESKLLHRHAPRSG